jgi:predicted chitinase
MTDEKTKVKSGVTVSKEAVFIGDFVFKFQGNLIKQYKEWKDACNGDVTEYEQTAKELMAKHYAFYGQFQKENKYVKRGSILWCSGGSKLTAFDILHDHGVVQKDGTPIGICTDCKANENIYTFEGCKIPAPAGYPERPVVTIKSQPQATLHKCIPMLNGSWSKSKSSKIKIWDESTGKYADTVTTGDFLTCFYGGIIEIVEVPAVNGTKGTGNSYITKQNLIDIGWSTDEKYLNDDMVKELNSMLVKYGITKPEQIYHFLSQVMKESDDWYKKGLGDGVIEIGSNSYISSRYEGRKDLGNTQKGDGILFKGAGYLHLTGRSNYTAFYNYMKGQGVDDPSILSQGYKTASEKYAWETATWYWSIARPSLNTISLKQGSIVTRTVNDDGRKVTATGNSTVFDVTKLVNGGTNGILDRIEYYNSVKEKIIF